METQPSDRSPAVGTFLVGEVNGVDATLTDAGAVAAVDLDCDALAGLCRGCAIRGRNPWGSRRESLNP